MLLPAISSAQLCIPVAEEQCQRQQLLSMSSLTPSKLGMQWESRMWLCIKILHHGIRQSESQMNGTQANFNYFPNFPNWKPQNFPTTGWVTLEVKISFQDLYWISVTERLKIRVWSDLGAPSLKPGIQSWAPVLTSHMSLQHSAGWECQVMAELQDMQDWNQQGQEFYQQVWPICCTLKQYSESGIKWVQFGDL